MKKYNKNQFGARVKVSPYDFLICPTCMERLTIFDLEGYARCPYCDHAFEMNHKMENFLLAPVVQAWSLNVRREISAED